MILHLKNGSGIHIKKKNRGKFTSYCGGNVTSACIAKAKRSGNPTLVKRATFAANARKWKHQNGGTLRKYQIGGYMQPQNVYNALQNGTAAQGLLSGAGKVMDKVLPSWMQEAGTYLSPLNYLAAISEGSIDPKVGEEAISKWHPNLQLVSRLGELILGGKAIKNTSKVAINTTAKSGNKTARAYLISKELNNAIKQKNGTYEPIIPENRITYTLQYLDKDGKTYNDASFIKNSQVKNSLIPNAKPSARKSVYLKGHGLYPGYSILPGFHLKGLQQGSVLEQQLSKSGTISTKAVKQLANNSSKFEGQILNRIVDTKFPNQKVIDYNSLRRTVQEELIPYQTVPTTQYREYGLDRLGLNTFYFKDGEFVRDTPVSFTFESPNIPMGNGLHYGPHTLGHTRGLSQGNTFTVIESQSDWAQNPWGRVTYNKMSKAAPHRLSQLRKMIQQQKERGLATESTEARIPYQVQYRDVTAEHIKHLQDTYPQRQLQENMLYASRNGYERMRYPTRDTAIKVQGYEPTLQFKGNPQLEQYAKNLQEQILQIELQLQQGTNIINYRNLSIQLDNLKQQYNILKQQSTDQIYSPQEETVLRRYDQFPRMFGKVFKDQEPQIVQDAQGNSWFEFTVPKNMQQRELIYKNGGVV